MSCRSGGKGAVIVQGCEPATFSISPHTSKPFRLDELTSWTKVPFAFHFLNDKRGEKVLYIVMLPHPCDISRIEVQARDQYKLKVNTKRRRRGDTSPCLASSLRCCPLFVQEVATKDEERIRKLKSRALSFIYLL